MCEACPLLLVGTGQRWAVRAVGRGTPGRGGRTLERDKTRRDDPDRDEANDTGAPYFRQGLAHRATSWAAAASTQPRRPNAWHSIRSSLRYTMQQSVGTLSVLAATATQTRLSEWAALPPSP